MSTPAARAGGTGPPDGAWAVPAARVVPAVLRARPAAGPANDGARPEPDVPARPRPRTEPAPRPVVAFLSRPRFGLPLTIGQLAAWQVVLTLIGLTAGRPVVVAAPAIAVAGVVLALTVVRFRGRWLYQWVSHYRRFRRRELVRLLPKEDGARAVLHLFAPDAMVTALRLGTRDLAVLNRTDGAAALVHLDPPNGAPITTLPRPRQLLDGASPGVAAQVVYHGVSGRRNRPLAWLTVRAVRASESADEDGLTAQLGTATGRVLDELTAHGIRATTLDRTETLRAVAALAHVGTDRRDVRESWRTWRCGSVVQAAFRLTRWPALSDQDCRTLLRRLLTDDTGGVVTVALSAGARTGESAMVRVAASGGEELAWSVRRVRAVAAAHGVRLIRLNGEHADGIAAVLPLSGTR